MNSNTSEASFGNIQIFDSVINQLNNEVGQAVTSGDTSISVKQDDDMISEESLDENHIVEQGLIHELCSSILPEYNINSTNITDPYVSLENIVL
ncbi:12327_t:CDS:2, partial [Funneliformis geosporum]